MTKIEFAQVIDAYADAKVSGNKYLMEKMVVEIEGALNELFSSPNSVQEPYFEEG